jgi:hypothetical protein
VSQTFLQANWDFSWLPDKYTVAGARHYECAREALIESNLVLPAELLPRPPLYEAVDCERLGTSKKKPFFGPIWHLRFREPGARDFPRRPFQLLAPSFRESKEFSLRLEDLWRSYRGNSKHVDIRARVLLSKEELIECFVEQWKREGANPQRGAGSWVRRYKTDLKYLGATRVLSHLSRQQKLLNDYPFEPELKDWYGATL